MRFASISYLLVGSRREPFPSAFKFPGIIVNIRFIGTGGVTNQIGVRWRNTLRVR
jgi:hypothetical protein